MVAADRTSEKNSPCTRPTASQSSMRVRYMRVRTTSSSDAPALASASAAITKTRRVCPAASWSSAPTGPVPDKCTAFPTRTAREKPMMGSKGEPPLIFWRMMSSVDSQTVNSGQRSLLCPQFTVHWQLSLQPLLNQEADQIDHAAGVAPLVVVPAQQIGRA